MKNIDDQVSIEGEEPKKQTQAPRSGGVNMGNIRSGPNSFKTYSSDEEGAQDQVRLLGVYQNKHGLNTIDSVINRWAPVSDNNYHNDAYKSHIAKALGVGINDEIDLTDPVTAGKFAYAQAQFEHGANKVKHDENWFIDQASNQIGGNVPQRATSAKRITPPNGIQNIDDQVEIEGGESKPTSQPKSTNYAGIQNIDDQVELDTEPTDEHHAQPEENKTGIWQRLKNGQFAEIGRDVLQGISTGLLTDRDTGKVATPTGAMKDWYEENQANPEVANSPITKGATTATNIGETVGEAGAPLAAFVGTELATEGLATPIATARLGEALGPVVGRILGTTAGSVGAQETESVQEGNGLVVPDPKTTAIDVATGEGLNIAGKAVKAGSEKGRKLISEAEQRFQDWKGRFNEADVSAQAARDTYQEGANLGAYTGNSGDVIEQHYADLANQRAAERDVIAAQEPNSPSKIAESSKGTWFPDNSKVPTEEGGLTKTKQLLSKVFGLAETAGPGVKTAKKAEKIFKEGREAISTRDAGTLASIADIIHTGLTAVGHHVTGGATAALGYGAAAGKQYIERSHLRDIERVLNNKDLTGDQIRNMVGEIIQRATPIEHEVRKEKK